MDIVCTDERAACPATEDVRRSTCVKIERTNNVGMEDDFTDNVRITANEHVETILEVIVEI